MLNSIATYRETGRKVAQAMNDHDQARASSIRDWYLRALRLEHPNNRPAVDAAYYEGYKAERKSPLSF